MFFCLFVCFWTQLRIMSWYQLPVTSSSSSRFLNKMSSSFASLKPWNAEASLSDALPTNSSTAPIFLPSFFTPPLPATMKTSASEKHKTRLRSTAAEKHLTGWQAHCYLLGSGDWTNVSLKYSADVSATKEWRHVVGKQESLLMDEADMDKHAGWKQAEKANESISIKWRVLGAFRELILNVHGLHGSLITHWKDSVPTCMLKTWFDNKRCNLTTYSHFYECER